jgi:hypothetical protein
LQSLTNELARMDLTINATSVSEFKEYKAGMQQARSQTEGLAYFCLDNFFSFDWVKSHEDRVNIWQKSIESYTNKLIAN